MKGKIPLSHWRRARVFLAGLAFDFCVRHSAEYAHGQNFGVFVVEDACRGIDISGSLAEMQRSFAALNIPCIISSAIA
jgi:nicotinamidase/pyrazinamidase